MCQAKSGTQSTGGIKSLLGFLRLRAPAPVAESSAEKNQVQHDNGCAGWQIHNE